MSDSICMYIENGRVKIHDYVNGFNLQAPCESMFNIIEALDEIIAESRRGRLDKPFEICEPIRRWNTEHRDNPIYANWIQKKRASTIRDVLLDRLPEYDVKYDNIKDYLLKIFSYKRFIKKNIKEKLYKSSISRLKVISEKGEKLNEKSSC